MNLQLKSDHLCIHYFPQRIEFHRNGTKLFEASPYLCENPECKILHALILPTNEEDAEITFLVESKSVGFENCSNEFVARVSAQLTELDWSVIERYVRDLRNPDQCPYSDEQVFGILHNGPKRSVIGYHDVFPLSNIVRSDEVAEFTDEHLLSRSFVLDNYCVNPKCDCRGVHLLWYLSDSHVLTDLSRKIKIYLDLRSQNLEVEGVGEHWDADITPDKLLESLKSAPVDLMARFEERRQLLRKKVATIDAQRKPLGAIAVQTVGRRWGRNEKCFCGSGKKYKHCCF
ncbi:MAG: motif [Pseudomonadota bacterium]|jgi:hypothetical protein